jgi:CubicO group peptidase (beta-lactamase class C family)
MKPILAGLLFAFAALAEPPAAGTHGMDAARLALVKQRMQSFVDKQTIAGAVTLLQRHGTLASVEAVGWQDREARKPMRADSIFQIKSMTKPVTGVGIMILAEEGRLSLTDPVERHLPEFRNMWVTASGDGTTTRNLKRPSRTITIRDLMTHTSGMPSGTDLPNAYARSLAEAVAIFSQQPLEFEPGTKWLYSNTGLNTLGRIIEVVADKPYDQFIAERIFQPLGMKDSYFFPPESIHARVAIPYEIKDGKLVRSSEDPYVRTRKNPGPAGGMFSTASDMAAFYQMMINGGTLDGKRVLSKAAVDVMTSNHTGTMEAGHGPGLSFGLTWNVARTAESRLNLASIGTYSHGGAWGTYGWVDPIKDLVGVFMIQRAPGGSRAERNVLENLAASSIVE